MTRYFFGASHEEFPPEALLRHAVAAERAGFDGISASDHLQPWWEPGESGHTWVWLGAAGQATERIPLGTGVTPTGARYHPALIAQAWMTLERMFPGRPFLGIGSGEALNEVPVGDDWPSTEDQIARMDEALGYIRPPVEGRDDHRGRPLLPAEGLQAAHAGRPPAADLGLGLRPAGRRGRRQAGRRAVDAARPRVDARGDRRLPRGARKAGREGDGEIVFQALVSWAPERRRGARAGAQVEGRPAAGPLHRRLAPARRRCTSTARREMSDEEFAQNIIAVSDPAEHRRSACASSSSSAGP